MPEIVTCPDCGRKLRVPDDLLGKRVRCPGCNQKFLAETAEESLDEAGDEDRSSSYASSRGSPRRDDDYEAPKSRRRADEEDEDDEYRGRRRDYGSPEPSKADKRQGWERVRFGVNLVIISCWVLVGMTVVAITGWLLLILFGALSFASMAGSFSPTTPPSQQQAEDVAGQAAGTGCAILVGVIVVWGLIALFALAWEAARITGYGFCMGVAPAKKTKLIKGLAIATFCIALANIFLPTASCGGTYLMARTGAILYVGSGGVIGLLYLAEFICFLLVLRGVAAVMKKEGLAQNLVIYTIAVPVYFFIIMGLLCLLPFIGVAALLGVAASSSGASSASGAAGNFAGAGAALAIGGITCTGLMVLIGIALFIWFMVMLFQVRGAIDGWLDRN
jgi:hypothetical protein